MSDHPRVVLLNMPTDIRGFHSVDLDCEPFILLNARLAWEANRETYFHELCHIKDGDLYANEDAENLETKRHE